MLRSATFARRLAANSLPKCTAISTIQRNPISVVPTQHSTLTVTNLSHLIDTRYLSSSSRNLGSILEREITEETEAGAGSNELPEELDTLYNDISKNWTIVQGLTGIGSDETGGGATVRLYKKDNGSNGAKIGIVFHCQDTEEDNAFNEDMFNEEQEETEEEPATAVRFAVTVSKGGKTMVMQCRAAEEDLSVESAAVRDGDAEAALIALAGGEQLHSSLYQGPEFTELAEDLQEAFHVYVEKECGVDEDVTAFITMYSDYREQEEYVSWMKTANSILT